MDEKALLLAVTTKIFNKTESELLPLLYEVGDDGKPTGLKPDAADVLYNLDAGRVKQWKDRQTETATKVANEKTAQINSWWEGNLKQAFAIADDVKGEDLLNRAIELHKTASSGDGKGKTSKDYLELESKYKTTEQKLKEWEAKVQTEYVPKTEVERMNRLSVADSYSNRILSSLKLIKDDNPTIQQNKVKYFNAELRQRFDDIQQTEDGKVYALKNGERIENASGHAVELGEIVKEVALGFWLEEKQPPTGNSGNRNEDRGTGTGRLAEIDRLLADPNLTHEKKMALLNEKYTLQIQK